RLRYLGPHGIGNPRPTFLARGVALVEPPREVGRGHLRLRLRAGAGVLDGIGFHLAERLDPALLGPGPVDAVFQLQTNDYGGRERVQAKLLDVRPAAAAGGATHPRAAATSHVASPAR